MDPELGAGARVALLGAGPCGWNDACAEVTGCGPKKPGGGENPGGKNPGGGENPGGKPPGGGEKKRIGGVAAGGAAGGGIAAPAVAGAPVAAATLGSVRAGPTGVGAAGDGAVPPGAAHDAATSATTATAHRPATRRDDHPAAGRTTARAEGISIRPARPNGCPARADRIRIRAEVDRD